MAEIRVSQTPVEAVVKPSTTNARISQVVTEAIIKPTNTNLRISQIVLEAVVFQSTFLKTSQMAMEVIIGDSVVPPSTGRVQGPAVQCI